MPDLVEVASGLAFPEGPIAMPDGSVVLVEMFGPRLTRVQPDGSKETIAEIPGGPNGAAVGPGGLIYVCNNGGRFTKTDMGGGLVVPGCRHDGQLHRRAHPDRRPGDGRRRGPVHRVRRPAAAGPQRPGVRRPRRVLLHRPRPRRRRGPGPPHGRPLLRHGRRLVDPRDPLPVRRPQRHRPVARRLDAVLGRDVAGPHPPARGRWPRASSSEPGLVDPSASASTASRACSSSTRSLSTATATSASRRSSTAASRSSRRRVS